MANMRLRQLSMLDYGDPRGFLVRLHALGLELAASDAAERIKRLRTNNLKPEREMRDAAIFCVGMSERIGRPILFAPVEEADFDFVAQYTDGGGVENFVPIQLKEVAPKDLNPLASLEAVIAVLARYGDSADLTVAIKISGGEPFDPAAVEVPQGVRVAALWVFAAITPDQEWFGLWGDFMDQTTPVTGSKFQYPHDESAS